ncbi:GLPGLI family protein [Flavobacteriaceae bacterium Ap0902]|nr:GLPGLI family protein [Flavobacteriaceae bacterium Ap0902]
MKLLYVLLLVSIGLQAQVITYEQTANVENQLKNIKDKDTRKRVSAHLSKPIYYNLYYQNNTSLYREEGPSKSEKDNLFDIKANGSSESKKFTVGTNNQGIYIDHNKNELIEGTNLLGKSFLIKDKVPQIDWKLTNETKKIENFECKKATADFEGTEITAWYTESIPLPLGPRYYKGLPGLIVLLSTKDLNFKAISIHKLNSNIELTIPNEGNITTLEEFKRIKEEKINALKQGRFRN